MSKRKLYEISKEKIGRYVARASDELNRYTWNTGFEQGRNVGSGRATMTNPTGTKKNPMTAEFHKNSMRVQRRRVGLGLAGQALSGKKRASERTPGEAFGGLYYKHARKIYQVPVRSKP